MKEKDIERYDNHKEEVISTHKDYEMLKKHEEKRKLSKRYTSKLWLWLGVLVLVLILLYWIFFIGVDLGVNQ